MPFVAGALLPHPPLLVPELCGDSPGDLDELRGACRRALETVIDAADLVVLIGDGPVWGRAIAGAKGSFAPYGAPVRVELAVTGEPAPLAELPEPAPITQLPLSLAVAAFLLTGLAPEELHAYTVPASLGPEACAAIGCALAGAVPARQKAAAVALGDLSCWRAATTSTGLEAESERFETTVRTAFLDADLGLLAGLDPAVASELVAPARAPLQVLAGALGGGQARGGRQRDGPGSLGGAGALRGGVGYAGVPFGVSYLVGVLEPA